MGSAGQLVSGTVAKVVRPDGTLAGPGEPGELWVQGGQIASGYYKNEQAYVTVRIHYNLLNLMYLW